MSVRQQVTPGSGLQALHLQKWLLLLLLAGSVLRSQGLEKVDFFTFGNPAGDRFILLSDDDNSRPICPTVPYVFLGVERSCYYVSDLQLGASAAASHVWVK